MSRNAKALLSKTDEKPVVKTWYEQGSIKIKIAAVNPSKDSAQKVMVEAFLPKEIVPVDIISAGGLELTFDYEKSLYKVYKEITLKPEETKIFEVEMKDIWLIPPPELDVLKEHTAQMQKLLEKTAYAIVATDLAKV